MTFSFGLVWVFLGLFFLFTEMMCPGFIIFFFGLGALFTAGLYYLVDGLSFHWQVTLFLCTSLSTLALGRCCFKSTFKGKQEQLTSDADDDGFIGCKVKVVEAISPETPGRIELHGSTWCATAKTTLDVGQKVTIVARNNITFVVEP